MRHKKPIPILCQSRKAINTLLNSTAYKPANRYNPAVSHFHVNTSGVTVPDSCHLIRSSPVKSMLMMPTPSTAHSKTCTQTLKNTNTNSKQYNTIPIDSTAKQHLSQMHNHHEQQLQQLHLEKSVSAAVNGRSNTYFQMNRMQQRYAHNASIDIQQQQHQMNTSFHGIQLQNHLPNNTGVERNDYRLQNQTQHQTATVHGEFE